GIISRVIADGYIILHAYAPEHAIADGMSCDLDATLCKRTIESASILAVPDISSVMDITSPCFDTLMPKSYIGTPLTVNGRLYGTLSFVSEEQRDTAFSESDQDFVQIMAEWIAISLERQQNRDELATYASNLEKSNVELEQFAYAASHDLQEPLRKIQTFGSRLESKYGDKLEGRGLEYLTRMQSAAGRMQALIQDLLSLSRVTTQAQPLEKIDLNDVIDEVLVDIEVQVSKANAEICVSELPIIEADKTQMRQLFQNLITNAIKFAREDIPPSVVIESQLHTSTAILEVEISVSDNGIGFEPRYAERIFSVFQRLHGRGEYEGTGVGLALCRKIVERHNGTIIAHGKPNEGATFMITLPVDNVNV
ncbi:MAG: ATP-binding protein, partial [Chloroflexota bacterium]